MVGPPRRRAEPQVPIERVGHGRLLLRPLDALRPIQRQLAAVRRPIGPDVRLPHRADRAVLEPLGHQPVALEGHALVSHLRGDLMLPRGLGQGTGLIDRVGERLLAVDVLSALDGRHRDDRVVMIRRAHDDRVDPLLLVEHLAEVFVFRGPRILVEGVRRVAPIDVGQGHDVLVLDLLRGPSRPGRRRPRRRCSASRSAAFGRGRPGHGGARWRLSPRWRRRRASDGG